jgi:PAS domain S-box-containing protein
MIRLYINRKILLGLTAIIIIIFTLGATSFWYSREVIHSSRLGSHSQLLVLCSEQVRSLVAEIEVAESKSHLSGSVHESFGHLIYQVKLRMVELDSLGTSSQGQTQRIVLLQQAILKKIKNATDGLKNRPEARAANDSLRLQISKLIDSIQAQENILKRERATRVSTQFLRFAYSFFGLLAAGLLILTILIHSLNTNLKARAQAEKKLQLASTSVRDLYEHAPCGYFSFDKEGMFSGVNQTLLTWLGYSREKVVHHFHLSNIFSDEIRMLYNADHSEVKQKGTIRDLEATVIRQDGSTFPVIINASVVVDHVGQYAGCRCTLFDNTERKDAEDKARLLARELEAFTYSVSHDLRSPLRSINGYAQILKEDHSAQLDEEGKKVLTTVINNAVRMENLIDDLLNFSLSNRKEIAKSTIDMNKFVSQIINELIDSENGRQVRVNISDLGSAVVDPSMFRQVWINLLTNALKYSRKREVTIIDVHATDKPNEIIYTVTDNGAGFDMKYYDKLFGVFSRLHKQNEFEGTGVGLALVQRIIQRHNGRIWAEAKENEGATFHFTIAKIKSDNPT